MSNRATKKAERRAQLVGGLRVVLATRGYEGATIASIAREAGLAPGLAHYHFQSKQAILIALVQELIATARDRFERRDVAGLSPLQRLDAFIDALTALDVDADTTAVACWARIGAEAQRLPEGGALYQQALAESHETLRELVVDTAPDVDAALVATGLLAAIEGAFRLGVGAPDMLPDGHAAGLVKRMARGLLGIA